MIIILMMNISEKKFIPDTFLHIKQVKWSCWKILFLQSRTSNTQLNNVCL